MEDIVKPLDMAADSLLQVRNATRKLMMWPLLLIPIGFAIMTVSEYLGMGTIHWYKDPFLGAIMAIFIYAQIMMYKQLKKVTVGENKVDNVLKILSEIPVGSQLGAMRTKILNASIACHMRDTLIRWIDLGTQAETSQFSIMMNNGAKRRAASVNKQMSVHISINRMLLKLGFLGTLIGLSMAFTPMKQAILSLDIAGQEGSYVRKIANAIDADAYAILATLVATAFSVFVEGIAIQSLRKIYISFENVNNLVDEWCMTEFVPWIKGLKVGNDAMDKELAMQKKFQDQVLELKKDFLAKMIALQQDAESKVGKFQEESIAKYLSIQEQISGKMAEFQKRTLQFVSDSQNQLGTLQKDSVEKAAAMHKQTLESFSKTQAELNSKVLDFQTGSANVITNNQKKMIEMQSTIRDNIETLIGTVSKTGMLTEAIVPMQKAFGARVEELAEYERQYRSFLGVKNNVKVPSHLKPEAQV